MSCVKNGEKNGEYLRHFAVFGNPIAHSKSPLLHNAVFEKYRQELGFFGAYGRVLLPLDISASEFRRLFFSLKLFGANVTVPFKEVALSAADFATQSARAIGAANTLFLKDNKLIADNTDADGFFNSLLESEIADSKIASDFLESKNADSKTSSEFLESKNADSKTSSEFLESKCVDSKTSGDFLESKNADSKIASGFSESKTADSKVLPNPTGFQTALILGAGGAAKAIAYALKTRGISTTIANRSANRLEFFRPWQGEFFKTTTFENLKIAQFDLVVNATSAGLSDESLPLDERVLTKILEGAKLGVDIIYGHATPFLKLAASVGIKTCDGLPMLISQAVLSNYHFCAYKLPLSQIKTQMDLVFAT